MRLFYYQDHKANFGDDLNPWLWPKLLPGCFDNDPQTVFLGIGSIIGHPDTLEAKQKIVFGSGFVPEYFQKPDISKGEWIFYFVRGPQTAAKLGLENDLAVGDSAYLVESLVEPPPSGRTLISFMPHWESVDRGHWEKACKRAKINYINPSKPVEECLEQINKSHLVLSEAMHGAIIADALRVPWIPLLPIHGMHRNKWLDWLQSINIELHPSRLYPSSLTEASEALINYPLLSGGIERFNASPFQMAGDACLTEIAAMRLKALSKKTPYLSDSQIFDRIMNTMLDKLNVLKNNYLG